MPYLDKMNVLCEKTNVYYCRKMSTFAPDIQNNDMIEAKNGFINEEKVLTKGLIGYTDYKNKVKYRLIPFIW